MMKRKGYIYVLCDPSTDLFKIGLTTGSIEKRMKKLQTGNGTELHIITYHETNYPYKVEKMLHNKFSPKKELNEWFALTNEDLSEFGQICEGIEQTIESLLDNPFFTPT